jgi:hypothetical protein
MSKTPRPVPSEPYSVPDRCTEIIVPFAVTFFVTVIALVSVLMWGG